MWDVTSYFSGGLVAGIGGQYEIYVLRSPCNSNGQRYVITVHAVGPSAGGALKCQICFEAPGKVNFGGQFDDHSVEPNPNAFNGPYLSVGAGFQLLGFGGTYGDTVLGSATSLRTFTPAISFGTISAEISGTIGTSTVTDVKTESCNCE